MRKAILTSVIAAAMAACAHQSLNAADSNETLELKSLDAETRKRLGATEPNDLIMVIKNGKVILYGTDVSKFRKGKDAPFPYGKTLVDLIEVVVVKGSHCPWYRDGRGNKVYYHC